MSALLALSADRITQELRHYEELNAAEAVWRRAWRRRVLWLTVRLRAHLRPRWRAGVGQPGHERRCRADRILGRLATEQRWSDGIPLRVLDARKWKLGLLAHD